MRKYGKWVLTLSLLAATPGLTFAASEKSKDAKSSTGTRASRTDNQRVAEDIANALRGKVQGEISIEYKDGTAVLSGSVMDPKYRDKASELVKKVSGVSKVDNRITVAEKKKAFTERLRGGGQDTSAKVTQAGHSADAVKQSRVQQVNSELPEAATSQGADSVATRNQEIAQQIGDVLTSAQLDGYDIQIRFQNGVAMLDGTVGTQAERAAAQRAAASVQGVRSVANRLRCADEANVAGRGPYGPPQGGVQGAGYMQGAPAQYAGLPQYPGQQMSAQNIPAPPAPGQGYPGGYQGGPAGYQGGPGSAPPYPPTYGNPGMGGGSPAVYNSPNMPDHSWPSYAQYPNSAAVSYPQQYSASAWPYIGPFYPYPQVPLGWRDATLRWDDGQWNLMFKPRTDRWWWFLNPHNW
jgi:osmotically-inducible protein OsmY